MNVYPSEVDVVDEVLGVAESGRSEIAVVAADNSAVDDPFAFVATTETLMNFPMSESVNT